MVQDYRTVVIPTIDVISNDTFEYSRQHFPSKIAARGYLDLNFDYKVLDLLVSALLKPTKPFETPIMSASMFAINADYFWKLGGFDTSLNTYGKLELI